MPIITNYKYGHTAISYVLEHYLKECSNVEFESLDNMRSFRVAVFLDLCIREAVVPQNSGALLALLIWVFEPVDYIISGPNISSMSLYRKWRVRMAQSLLTCIERALILGENISLYKQDEIHCSFSGIKNLGFFSDQSFMEALNDNTIQRTGEDEIFLFSDKRATIKILLKKALQDFSYHEQIEIKKLITEIGLAFAGKLETINFDVTSRVKDGLERIEGATVRMFSIINFSKEKGKKEYKHLPEDVSRYVDSFLDNKHRAIINATCKAVGRLVVPAPTSTSSITSQSTSSITSQSTSSRLSNVIPRIDAALRNLATRIAQEAYTKSEQKDLEVSIKLNQQATAAIDNIASLTRNDISQQAICYANIAKVLFRLRNYRQSIEFFAQAIANMQRISPKNLDDIRNFITFCMDAAGTNHILNDFKAAAEFYNMAINSFAEITSKTADDTRTLANCYTYSGAIQKKMGNFKKAAECNERAAVTLAELKSKTITDIDNIIIYLKRAEINIVELDRLDSAAKLDEKIIMDLQDSISENPVYIRDIANYYMMVGAKHLQQGNFAKAAALNEKAITFLEKLTTKNALDLRNIASCSAIAGRAYFMLKHFGTSANAYAKAVMTLEVLVTKNSQDNRDIALYQNRARLMSGVNSGDLKNAEKDSKEEKKNRSNTKTNDSKDEKTHDLNIDGKDSKNEKKETSTRRAYPPSFISSMSVSSTSSTAISSREDTSVAYLGPS
jgi:tetratricopeptide (TPR) repeat protein